MPFSFLTPNTGTTGNGINGNTGTTENTGNGTTENGTTGNGITREENLKKQGCMSIKNAIANKIQKGDNVTVRKRMPYILIDPFRKPISGKLQYIDLNAGAGSETPNPTITLLCLDDICKQSKDRYGSKVTSSKSFGNDYCVKFISASISPTTGGKSRKYKKSKKSRKTRKSRK